MAAHSSKPGRNEPCHCGSGRKYKKCHLDHDAGRWPTSPETAAAQRSRRPPIQTMWPAKRKRARAVGSRVYLRPPDEAFVNFLWNLVKWTFGETWWKGECTRPDDDRHQVVKWFYDLSAWDKANGSAERFGYMRAAKPSGSVQSLTTFAYDIYTLAHAMPLPDRLIERLKDRHEFQGARYELAVAALVCRAGFEINFVPEKDGEPHCEFIASDGPVSFGVEAKSRRRRGVLHEPGVLDEAKAIRGDVQALFEKASTQGPPNLPFVIFIDLNCPPTPEHAENPLRAPWWADVSKTLETYGVIIAGTEHQQPSFNALVVTNFSTHYFGHEKAATTGERLLIPIRDARHTLSGDVLVRLWTGVRRYGGVPVDPD